jgi:hypothetical protein
MQNVDLCGTAIVVSLLEEKEPSNPATLPPIPRTVLTGAGQVGAVDIAAQRQAFHLFLAKDNHVQPSFPSDFTPCILLLVNSK